MGFEEFEATVIRVLPEVVGLIPRTPAAELGRWQPKNYRQERSRVQTALNEVGGLLAERLLGALELAVDQFTVDFPPALVTGVDTPASGGFGIMTMGGESETRRAVVFVEQLHPGATDRVIELVELLRNKASVPHAQGDEESIAAQHGAAHLALAVVVSTAVLRALNTEVSNATPAIVGVALGAAVTVLTTAPMPPGYATAVLEKHRAEYRVPQSSSGSAVVTDHRFWLAEAPVQAAVDFTGNGLVAAVPGGVVIRTALAEGHVTVSVNVLAAPPKRVELTGWDEVVDISWTAPAGDARLSGATAARDRRPWGSPPWAGDYRVRVQAHGRDEPKESYQLTIWRAPASAEVVHKKTDGLGRELRGETALPVVTPPDAGHRWISESWLNEAATFTVVTGLGVEDVLRAFGADPAKPMSIKQIAEQPPWERISQPQHGYRMLVSVLAFDNVVLALEENGFQGSSRELITSLSANGRAASVYWNVNGRFDIAFAERGELLSATNPPREPFTDLVSDHVRDLDFEDYRHRTAKGLTAVARFIGRDVSAEDLAAVYAADRVFLIEHPAL